MFSLLLILLLLFCQFSQHFHIYLNLHLVLNQFYLLLSLQKIHFLFHSHDTTRLKISIFRAMLLWLIFIYPDYLGLLNNSLFSSKFPKYIWVQNLLIIKFRLLLRKVKLLPSISLVLYKNQLNYHNLLLSFLSFFCNTFFLLQEISRNIRLLSRTFSIWKQHMRHYRNKPQEILYHQVQTLLKLQYLELFHKAIELHPSYQF